jgi:hypothetical protein
MALLEGFEQCVDGSDPSASACSAILLGPSMTGRVLQDPQANRSIVLPPL